MTKRPYVVTDAAAVRQLVDQVMDEYGIVRASGDDWDLVNIDAAYAGGLFEVLVDGFDTVVGTVGVRVVKPGIGELRRMYLPKKARGQGLGRDLLEHALARAKTLGMSRIELETASAMTAAIALYESRGFRRIERSGGACGCDRSYALEL